MNGGRLQFGAGGGGGGGASSIGSGGVFAGNIFIADNATFDINFSGNVTLSGDISGDGDLEKSYGGTLILAGDNTYTGKTFLKPETTTGVTVSVDSFNSVNGGTPLMASSSLGAPTTVADGTIEVGATSRQASVRLIYTGTGETTDRVLKLNTNGNGQRHTIENAGPAC